MDPITQGALGAIAGQGLIKTKKLVPITLMATLAGMSPDLDIIIRSDSDQLLFLEYHRQFTHSLFFIPFGALICSLIFYPLIAKRYQISLLQTYLTCIAGYATHALIDACTSYGTLLLWPFSNERFAWNNMAIIDLAYTLPILAAIFFGIKIKSQWPARLAICWALLYPSVAYFQSIKAEKAAHLYLQTLSTQNALNQNQSANLPNYNIIQNLSAKPSMSNIVLWKIIYETDERYYVDALKVGLFDSAADAVYIAGNSVAKLNIDRDLPWLDLNSQQAKDIERFSWFSMGYLAYDDGKYIDSKDFKEPELALPMRIMDVRYSMVPNEINPLWSIGLDPNADEDQHVTFDHHRDASSERRSKFFNLLFSNINK